MNRRLFIFLAWLGFMLYGALLTKNILFKHGNYRYYKAYFKNEYPRYSVKRGWKEANTVPFHTINRYYRNGYIPTENARYNLYGNLLGFIPFGIFFPLLLRRMRHLLLTVPAGFALSFMYEYTQVKTGLGYFDVDDLLLNTGGVLAGYLLFWVTSKLWRRKATSDERSN
ncbi:MAG: VanZ family protein [Chitinophagales bacterium]|nr:VanZ family protein [Chitinophagales bacterium]